MSEKKGTAWEVGPEEEQASASGEPVRLAGAAVPGPQQGPSYRRLRDGRAVLGYVTGEE